MTSRDFETLRGLDWSTDYQRNVLRPIHSLIMERAETYAVSDTIPLGMTFDASGRRILQVARKAESRIIFSAYAFLVSGDGRYLETAKRTLREVCNFRNWNPSHYLDVGEMSLAVAYGYDWLYRYLDDAQKREIESAIYRFAFQTSLVEDDAWFYDADSNWNSVCNGGLVTAALAVYEKCDTAAQRIIEDAVRTNSRAASRMYSAEGGYSEGPAYWNYGTMFQVLMMSAMETAAGTDFDLSKIGPLMATPKYKLFTYGSSGLCFNYMDNPAYGAPAYPLWYFAMKNNDPSLLVKEMEYLRRGEFLECEESRVLPLLMYYALKMDFDEQPLPKDHFYYASGWTPVIMARGNWKSDGKDWFLGLKGGSAGINHGHMDAGSFVYDAYGYRWSMDLSRENYARLEKIMKSLGGSFWNSSQNGMRWRSFRMNNLQHSTLTINGKDHNVKGKAEIVETIDTGKEQGGVLDLTPVFGGDVESATRRAVVRKDGSLEIVDTITAPSGKDAHVRWTMVTPAEVSPAKNGFTLRQDKVSMRLDARGKCGKEKAELSFRTWSSNPADYDGPMAKYDQDNPGVSLCGYETSIPAGETLVVRVTLRKK